MPTVLLMRHASAARKGARDRDRPLDAEGRLAADRAGAWLAQHGPEVDAVFCSSAVRATETWERLRASWGTPLQAQIDDRYYMAGALLERLQALQQNVTQPLIIGHNPELQELALLLAAGGERYHLLQASLPTGALAGIELPSSDWACLRPGSGVLRFLVTPNDLRGA